MTFFGEHEELDAIMSCRKKQHTKSIERVNWQWTGKHDYYAPFPDRAIEIIGTFVENGEIKSMPELSTMKAWRKSKNGDWIEISVDKIY